MQNTLVIINNRDRVTSLCQLITWLMDAGYWNITVLDNDSTYPPLLEYYDALEGLVNVVMLRKNLLSKALWAWGDARKLIRGPFVYTDSDILPIKECPDDVIGFLMNVSDVHGMPNKVGLGLKIDDIPDCYSPAPMVRQWEGQYWEKQIGSVQNTPIYSAPVDTTFAYYSEFRPFSLDGIRTGYPYVARHLPWYLDSASPSEEDEYYEDNAQRGCHNWALTQCFSQAVLNHAAKNR